MLPFRKHKERVEIISGNTVKSRKKYHVENGYVIIQKGGKGRGKTAWNPQFTESCFKYKRNILGILKRTLAVKEGSENCIDYGKENEDVKMYPITLLSLKHWYESKLLQHAGQSTQQIKVPLILYLIVGGVLILQVIDFMISQGMIIR